MRSPDCSQIGGGWLRSSSLSPSCAASESVFAGAGEGAIRGERGEGSVVRLPGSHSSKAVTLHIGLRASPRTLTGKAYVTDGDGIRVDRQEVRLVGLDAPEWDQKAKHRDGYWFKHGKRVKSALIQEIGGRHVRVSVEGVDKFGRLLGTVTYKGRDIGEWLVREGHAIAAYSDRYMHVEREAREEERGMWSHAPQL